MKIKKNQKLNQIQQFHIKTQLQTVTPMTLQHKQQALLPKILRFHTKIQSLMEMQMTHLPRYQALPRIIKINLMRLLPTVTPMTLQLKYLALLLSKIRQRSHIRIPSPTVTPTILLPKLPEALPKMRHRLIPVQLVLQKKTPQKRLLKQPSLTSQPNKPASLTDNLARQLTHTNRKLNNLAKV